MRNRIITFVLLAIVTLVLLLVVEGIAYAMLGSKDIPTRFLFGKQSQTEARLAKGGWQYSAIDPQLGYSHNLTSLHNNFDASGRFEVLPGFLKYPNTLEGQGDPFVVVALGGSTTDGTGKKVYGWPEVLQKIFNREGINAQVYNGGVGGYASSQELLKTLRDVLPMQPDLVMSLNGINDLGFMHNLPEHPYVHRYTDRTLRLVVHGDDSDSRFLPSTMRLIRIMSNKASAVEGEEMEVSLGPDITTEDVSIWERNVRMMHTICQAEGAEYRCFLQPTMGVGEYNPTKEELQMLDDTHIIKNYLSVTQQFYNTAQSMAAERPYITDMVNVFEGMSGIYRDSRHQTAEGVDFLAERIFDVIRDQPPFAVTPMPEFPADSIPATAE